VIVAFDGRAISGPERLRWVASLAGVGKTSIARVARGSRIFDLKITLDELRTAPTQIPAMPFP